MLPLPYLESYVFKRNWKIERRFLIFVFFIVFSTICNYRVFSHDVTAAMLVSQNKEMAAMLVSQTKPLGIELYFYANTFFCFSKPKWSVVT